MQPWDGVERRTRIMDRRLLSDRRSGRERRTDFRESDRSARRSVTAWVRSFANARQGVDRRKGLERRAEGDRRREGLQSLLTPEELALVDIILHCHSRENMSIPRSNGLRIGR